jgi:oxygen-independent coproporphyrinogen-3 oxidase
MKHPSEPTGVYVHIPFCTGTCSYCHYARVSNTPQMVDAYVDSVKKELSIHKTLGGEITADSLYLGGGTPTYLNETQITEFLKNLRENINQTKDIEVTVESSPETLSKEKLHALKTAGVNRLSIGVQAFDDYLLTKVCNLSLTVCPLFLL